MLKRKRKINKATLIASSRRYYGPLPTAYAELRRRGVAPTLAQAMVEDASGVAGCVDGSNLGAIVIWHHTKFWYDWCRAAGCL
jgi:hypothetical protein